ncbi:hypothetical protein F2P81_009590 [Scophthalmus maximus]|uniref:Uncharacterized protein n=1 Tax=Scophthalmus maximus TaxID=52904 RepID=A0A6A4SV48_SCOMX|nr:hypothetical protein F2P81_009590 [Scophthalmus maximus]
MNGAEELYARFSNNEVIMICSFVTAELLLASTVGNVLPIYVGTVTHCCCIRLIRSIWINPCHTTTVIVGLFCKMSNEIIRHCSQSISLDKIFKGYVIFGKQSPSQRPPEMQPHSQIYKLTVTRIKETSYGTDQNILTQLGVQCSGQASLDGTISARRRGNLMNLDVTKINDVVRDRSCSFGFYTQMTTVVIELFQDQDTCEVLDGERLVWLRQVLIDSYVMLRNTRSSKNSFVVSSSTRKPDHRCWYCSRLVMSFTASLTKPVKKITSLDPGRSWLTTSGGSWEQPGRSSPQNRFPYFTSHFTKRLLIVFMKRYADRWCSVPRQTSTEHSSESVAAIFPLYSTTHAGNTKAAATVGMATAAMVSKHAKQEGEDRVIIVHSTYIKFGDVPKLIPSMSHSLAFDTPYSIETNTSYQVKKQQPYTKLLLIYHSINGLNIQPFFLPKLTSPPLHRVREFGVSEADEEPDEKWILWNYRDTMVVTSPSWMTTGFLHCEWGNSKAKAQRQAPQQTKQQHNVRCQYTCDDLVGDIRALREKKCKRRRKKCGCVPSEVQLCQGEVTKKYSKHEFKRGLRYRQRHFECEGRGSSAVVSLSCCSASKCQVNLDESKAIRKKTQNAHKHDVHILFDFI